jgi:diacylglycerol kinase
MVTMAETPTDVHIPEPPAVRRRRRPWRDKFREAFRGIKLGIRGHSSFFVHFFVAALVLAAGWAFQCSPIEWCILLGCVGAVLVVELINSAIETLGRGLGRTHCEHTRVSLEIAAGAVLLTSIFAAAIGTIIFGRKVLELLLAG